MVHGVTEADKEPSFLMAIEEGLKNNGTVVVASELRSVGWHGVSQHLDHPGCNVTLSSPSVQ